VYCINCGIDLGATAKFCSSCGTSLPDATSVASKARDWDFHVNVLAWLTIAHAALVGVIGLIVMICGQFVNKLILENPHLFDNANPNDVPPPEVLNIVGPATFLIGIIFMFIALPSIAAGIGMLRYRNWGRMLALVMSFVRLLEFPFGTLTSIYAFWVLLSHEGKRFYSERAVKAES